MSKQGRLNGERILYNSRMGLSTSISYSRRTESNGLRMPGAVTSTSKTSLFVTSMTLLPAKKQPVARGIASRFRDYEHFETTGCNINEKKGLKMPESSEREIELPC